MSAKRKPIALDAVETFVLSFRDARVDGPAFLEVQRVLRPMAIVTGHGMGVPADEAESEMMFTLLEQGKNFDLAHESGASFSTFIMSHLKQRLKRVAKRIREEQEFDENTIGDEGLFADEPEIEAWRVGDPAIARARISILSGKERAVAELIQNGVTPAEIQKRVGIEARQYRQIMQNAARELNKHPTAAQFDLFGEVA